MPSSFDPPGYKLPDVSKNLPQWGEKKRKRVTAYLPADVHLDLHGAIHKMREMGEETDLSEFIRAAIDLVNMDLDQNGENSWIFARIAYSHQQCY